MILKAFQKKRKKGKLTNVTLIASSRSLAAWPTCVLLLFCAVLKFIFFEKKKGKKPRLSSFQFFLSRMRKKVLCKKRKEGTILFFR
jgi:hypothetical protein